MILKPFLNLKRCLSLHAPKLKEKHKMLAWCIHSYGDINELHLEETRVPVVSVPDDVLVEVKASSVNPIDTFMLNGYGRNTLKVLRDYKIEFPLVLGRDFSGTIISKGHEVKDNFKVGDEVYGFLPLHKQGSFSEIVRSSQYHIQPKPNFLSHEESASLAYATMTAWSALFLTGNLISTKRKSARVLVLGGSGGVGTAAIQLLKSQNCVVLTTCSTDAVPLVTSLGPDVVFDRKDPNFKKLVEQEGKYHIILDAANMGVKNIPSEWSYDTYITLNSPLLVNNDKHGLLCGLLTSAGNLLEANITRWNERKTVKWGFIVPSQYGFHFIHNLICKRKIKPVIHKTFPFTDLPCAIESLKEGHSRGKTVISYVD